MDHTHRAEDVGFELRFEVGVADGFERTCKGVGGVVDQNVDLACEGCDLFTCCIDGVLRRDVDRKRIDATLRRALDLLQGLNVAGGGNDVVAAFGQADGGFASDACGCACDEYGGHCFPLGRRRI
jgi:hypothetical protein